MMPTNDELEQMRHDLQAVTLPDTCIVLSVTETSNGMGGQTKAWGTATNYVACRMDTMSMQEQIAGGAMQPFTRMRLTVPWDTILTTAHRVKWSGTQYNVVSVNPGSWLISKRAIVEKV
jgi:SPP1 family predicted phage head-tail adaptor